MALQPQQSAPQYQFQPAPMSADEARIYADLPIQDLLAKARKGDLDATQELQVRTKEAVAIQSQRQTDPNASSRESVDMGNLVRSALDKMGGGLKDLGGAAKDRFMEDAGRLGRTIRTGQRYAEDAYERRAPGGMVVADDAVPGTIPAQLPANMMPEQAPKPAVGFKDPVTVDGAMQMLGVRGFENHMPPAMQNAFAAEIERNRGNPSIPIPEAPAGPVPSFGPPLQKPAAPMMPGGQGGFGLPSGPMDPSQAGPEAFMSMLEPRPAGGEQPEGAGGFQPIPMPTMQQPLPAPSPAEAMTGASAGTGAAAPKGRGYENLLRMGMALMAAGEPTPGATRGPTLGGAFGKAGLSTMDYAAQQSRYDDAKAFQKEQFAYKQKTDAAGAKRKAYEFDETISVERKKAEAEMINSATNLDIKRELMRYNAGNDRLERALKQQEIDVRVFGEVSRVQEQGTRDRRLILENTFDPEEQKKALQDQREQENRQINGVLTRFGVKDLNFGSKPSDDGKKFGSANNPHPKDAFAKGGKPASGEYYVSPKDGQIKRMP